MNWIKVDDALPESGKEVIVFTGGTAVHVGHYLGNECWIVDEGYKVTHWMALPAPPDESPLQTCPEVPTQTRGPIVPRPPSEE